MSDFCHLHSHTQYSLLDGAAGIGQMLDKAQADGMTAVAITDHGNLFGALQFYLEATSRGIKPIIGCEVYVVEDRFRKQFDRANPDKRYHQLLLAKNAKGYQNLCKLVSMGFLEGSYSGFPRVDLSLLLQYKEGLIASSCCIGAEVPQTYIHKGSEAAEACLQKWLNIFGEDYYIELQRHQLKDIDGSGVSQEDINQWLIKMGEKHGVPLIATNDSHYTEQEDWLAHDALLCVNTGDFISTPKGRGKGYRFGFENDQFFFKSQEEMKSLFADQPSAIENTMAIADKVEPLNLTRDVLLPNFQVPPEFSSQIEFLRHLSLQGAKRRYGVLDTATVERIEHELKIIQDMGFPGYFLIVQDFIVAAKKMGVFVGPGRGSGAGSVVAYATGITNIDPIKYNLIFERFLNPERVSMPDFDIDFDDEGRQKVYDYVINKYGKNQVAQIITFGTMAARSSVRDVGRVLELPLPNTDRIAKLIPEGPDVNLKSALRDVPELRNLLKKTNSLEAQTLELSQKLEGSVRHRGIHAAGVIIAPDDITNFIPVCDGKEEGQMVTQFDGGIIEMAGMLKMDFLGLKTLSILKLALETIKEKRGIEIDLDNIPLDDAATFDLYKRADTIGTFQFESDGMRSHLRNLKPDVFEDLIAMNALFRPGPMQFIPNFIDRKNGREPIEFPHEWLRELLEPTYGILVYQEQIMQCAQIMAGYSLGAADVLRRAMGKKKAEVMTEQKAVFLKGCAEKGVEAKTAHAIFDMMEKFAEYGFNRSHSAAYALIGYQTAYLKTHYPTEYLAAVLSNNMGDIKKVEHFMEEAKRMGIRTLVPDINESREYFVPTTDGSIRYALSALKGVGKNAVKAIVAEREANGTYKSIFDLCKRVEGKSVNRRTLESLTTVGAFDSLNAGKRSQYFFIPEGSDFNSIELAIKYGQRFNKRKSTNQGSLFGNDVMADVKEPDIPPCEPWPFLQLLKKEKQIAGTYLSGHPLDEFREDVDTFCNCRVDEIEGIQNKMLTVAGIIQNPVERLDKRGRKMGFFELEGFNGTHRFVMFDQEYLKYKHFFDEGLQVFIRGANKKRYQSSDRYYFEFAEMGLLANMRDRFAKELVVSLFLQSLDETIINQIQDFCDSNPGDTKLKLKVKDGEQELEVDLRSNQKVDLNNNSALRKLKDIPSVELNFIQK